MKKRIARPQPANERERVSQGFSPSFVFSVAVLQVRQRVLCFSLRLPHVRFFRRIDPVRIRHNESEQRRAKKIKDGVNALRDLLVVRVALSPIRFPSQTLAGIWTRPAAVVADLLAAPATWSCSTFQ